MDTEIDYNYKAIKALIQITAVLTAVLLVPCIISPVVDKYVFTSSFFEFQFCRLKPADVIWKVWTCGSSVYLFIAIIKASACGFLFVLVIEGVNSRPVEMKGLVVGFGWITMYLFCSVSLYDMIYLDKPDQSISPLIFAASASSCVAASVLGCALTKALKLVGKMMLLDCIKSLEYRNLVRLADKCPFQGHEHCKGNSEYSSLEPNC